MSSPPRLAVSDIAARLNEVTLVKNIPAAVTVELTRRCPLACAHCYLPETRGRAGVRAGRELTTAQWKKVLDQLARAGSLYLVFTGGEPLLRTDLAELCRYAKSLNFDVRVYSSGIGLARDLAAGLRRAGVSAFEISFYGRAPVHDAVTGLKGSFRKSLDSALMLKKAGINVRLKTPLMKNNFSERGWLERLAKKRGFGIAFDPVIAPGNDGDRSNLSLRLNGPQLVRVVAEMDNGPSGTGGGGGPDTQAHSSTPPHFHATTMDFFCGAGRNAASVDPYGNLSPCLQMPVRLGNLLRTPFKKIWRSSPWLKKWRALRNKDLEECRVCPKLALCNRCPGVSLIEEGSPLAPNAPACAMAEVALGKNADRP
jgi:radical SAM protein with 4Fe4S-binding SPASM domain